MPPVPDDKSAVVESRSRPAAARHAPPGRTPRRTGGERKPREQRWSELLEVATRTFYEKGYDATSLQDLADQLGMLKGSLYYYIRNKEDLLYAVIEDVHGEGLEVITGLIAGEGNAVERLRRTVIGHIEHECRNLTRTTVFLHELESLSPDRQVEIIGDDHAYRRVFSEVISEGQREGLIRADVEPKLGALWILGASNWVYRWFRPGGEFSAREIGERFADLIVRGLAEPSAVSSGVVGGMDLPPGILSAPPTAVKPSATASTSSPEERATRKPGAKRTGAKRTGAKRTGAKRTGAKRTGAEDSGPQ